MDSLGLGQTTIESANLNGENSGVDLSLNLGLPVGEDDNKLQFGIMDNSINISPNMDILNFHGNSVDQIDTKNTNYGRQVHDVFYKFLDENKIRTNDIQENAGSSQYSTFVNFHGPQNLGNLNQNDHQLVSDNHFYMSYPSRELHPSSSASSGPRAVDLKLSLAPPLTAMNSHYVHQHPAVTKLRSKAAREQLELNKRCANPLCNTNVTPLWRRGPLGLRTLCNACGIKYRKEEERKRTQEIMERKNNGASGQGEGHGCK